MPYRAPALEEAFEVAFGDSVLVDELVGVEILKTLEGKGELDETYVFFTSDNGFHMGEHRLGAGKMTPYSTDTNVPLITTPGSSSP
jgi:N-acetylglucosamine-6-sulfatase